MGEEGARPARPGRDRVDTEHGEQAAVVRSSPAAIMGITSAGVISSCNPAGAQLYGYPVTEMIGMPATIVIPPERRSDETAIFERALAGEVGNSYRTDRLRRDGSTVTVSVTLSPLVDSIGTVHGAAAIAHQVDPPPSPPRFDCGPDEHSAVGAAVSSSLTAGDDCRHDAQAAPTGSPTDRERLESQLQQGQRMEVLGQLAGGVAHDFNNLLAVILNYAAFVADELTVGAGADFTAAGRDVQQIQRAAERATALTHQLLAFARREIVQPRVLDLNEVVGDVLQMLDRTIGEDVVLRTQLGADLWPIMADPGQIEQVLVNLAINARDAMAGGGALTIDTTNLIVGPESVAAGAPVLPGRHIQLRVRDTGSGMTPDVIEHAFEPFYTTKRDGTGTGLGLSTVYGIVTQAGATIDIQSQPGTGTTFTILIPATDERAAAAAVADEPSYERTPKGETVLIVEDEQALREVTQRIFSNSGYHVITASDGMEAVDLAARYDGDIHLLVTDVVMPKMLGKEAADKIRELRPDIEVLYMSGYAQPVLASQSRLDPDVNLIEKPFSAAAIIEKAGRVLNGHFQGFRTIASPPDTDSPEPPYSGVHGTATKPPPTS